MEQWMVNGIIFFILFLSFDAFVIYRWIKVRKDAFEIAQEEERLRDLAKEDADTEAGDSQMHQ